ncbi:carbamoyltransferase C-terminal domain-containing protein [Pseudovibrio exalbescens]|uniref:carbamoyltransferase C-terminal domain-containing protein n=1 Tax=Pseudovibrio exalbescens TaxID=197461 RepID=UPI0023666360|nr:carbamoyltransferase C-terminal domain-containing protein [Pseudovibrio exalbescens]MDD7911565.1 carbamoyltransferase C-terminal domain-containing protein [Pseudovibrio exalbescens]
MQDGFYISAYCQIGQLEYLHRIALRHDQNISLWRKAGQAIELVQLWELERYSGQKHHTQAFYNTDHFREFLQERLAPLGLKPADIKGMWGTPGVTTDATDYWHRYGDFSQHSLAHLFSAMMLDKEVFERGCIVGLAVDGGPDSLEDLYSRDKPFYAGAIVKSGSVKVFPVPSTAPFWALLRQYFGLKEGSLMALASACRGPDLLPEQAPPPIFGVADFLEADAWFNGMIDKVNFLCDEEKSEDMDGRFSPLENKAAVMTRIIQACTEKRLENTVSSILKEHEVDPRSSHLAMAGGLALNCPANTHLMNTFGFKGFIAPPCVNDSGLSMGLGLMRFFEQNRDFAFKFASPYVGGRSGSSVEAVVASESFSPFVRALSTYAPSEFLEDIVKGPVVRICEGSEVGPRALGNRSLLADPRTERSKDLLNSIKQREWWRPVAPVVLEEHIDAWFEEAFPSPYMLHAFAVKPEQQALVPAICHLDGTARAQTLSRAANPALYDEIQAFARETGVPMLCNTSLNDRGEPILNSLEAALDFALKKELSVVYVDGFRLELTNFKVYQSAPPPEGVNRSFVPRQPIDWAEAERAANPLELTREELVLKQLNPRLRALDHKDPEQLPRLRKLLRRVRAQFSKRADFQFVDLAQDFDAPNTPPREAKALSRAEPPRLEVTDG